MWRSRSTAPHMVHDSAIDSHDLHIPRASPCLAGRRLPRHAKERRPESLRRTMTLPGPPPIRLPCVSRGRLANASRNLSSIW